MPVKVVAVIVYLKSSRLTAELEVNYLHEENMNNYSLTPKKVSKFNAFPYLYENYAQWLRPEITSINLFHNSGKCYLEIVSNLPQPKDPDEKQKLIQEIDLSFISCFLCASESIFDDAKTFIEDLDPISIINTLPLFTDAACKCIAVLSSNTNSHDDIN